MCYNDVILLYKYNYYTFSPIQNSSVLLYSLLYSYYSIYTFYVFDPLPKRRDENHCYKVITGGICLDVPGEVLVFYYYFNNPVGVFVVLLCAISEVQNSLCQKK
jgi:hypothetical protein